MDWASAMDGVLTPSTRRDSVIGTDWTPSNDFHEAIAGGRIKLNPSWEALESPWTGVQSPREPPVRVLDMSTHGRSPRAEDSELTTSRKSAREEKSGASKTFTEPFLESWTNVQAVTADVLASWTKIHAAAQQHGTAARHSSTSHRRIMRVRDANTKEPEP